jgi:serine phosphatase RsbU (regulator of sigma subunit)
MPVAEEKVMQCMEVWGGSEELDRGVVMPGLDAWIFSRPYDMATSGGDVHYVSTCAAGQVTRLLVADVSGHGSAVASVAADLRRLMRRYVTSHDQRSFVRALNRDFTASSDAGIFATAVAVTFEAPPGRLMLCNAGHPPPLHYSAKTRKWSLLDAKMGDQNVPWGIVDAAYEQVELMVAAGDLILLYTDALMEACGPTGEMLGPGGLRDVAAGLDVGDPATLIPRLLAALAGLSPENLQQDDVTCLLLRPNGLRPKLPFFDRWLAPFRFLAAPFGLRFGWTQPKR